MNKITCSADIALQFIEMKQILEDDARSCYGNGFIMGAETSFFCVYGAAGYTLWNRDISGNPLPATEVYNNAFFLMTGVCLTLFSATPRYFVEGVVKLYWMVVSACNDFGEPRIPGFKNGLLCNGTL